jgi:hypothetical protein
MTTIEKVLNQGTADIDAGWYLGVSGDVTVTGAFYDGQGNRAKTQAGVLAPSFTGTVKLCSTGPAKRLSQVAGLQGKVRDNYPNAEFFKGLVSGDVHEDSTDGAQPDSDFTSNYARYGVVPGLATIGQTFGRPQNG